MKRAWIRTLPRFVAFLSTGLISVLIFQTETQPTARIPLVPDTIPAPVETLTKSEDSEVFRDYEDDDRLFHQGYEVRKGDAKVPYEQPDEHGNLKTVYIDSSYVVVKKDGRTIAKFHGLESPLGSLADFGFADLVGDESEELIISLTISRGGRHWVVSLDPEFRVLFDSRDYDVGREDFSIIDIDKDGVHEICLPIVSFYGMEGLQSVGETPLPEIIFKYDAKQKRYLPANHLFVDYALRGLNPESEREIHRNYRFNVVLDYVYAGKEREGWASFDKHYPSQDKAVMKSRIEAVLKDDPVYKYIYKDRER